MQKLHSFPTDEDHDEGNGEAKELVRLTAREDDTDMVKGQFDYALYIQV